MQYDPDEYRKLVCAVAADPGMALELRRRSDSTVLRAPCADGSSVIIKLWMRQGLAGLTRRATRTGNRNREWYALSVLRRDGVSVPRPLFHGWMGARQGPYTEAMVMEDLGATNTGTEYVKVLLRSNQEDALARLEGQAIELAQAILGHGLADPDHGFHNILVNSAGVAFRIDFEVACRVVFPEAFPGLFSKMLGRLITTYAFAVQPDADRAVAFALRVARQVDAPRAVLHLARRIVELAMREQFETIGIYTPVVLPW